MWYVSYYLYLLLQNLPGLVTCHSGTQCTLQPLLAIILQEFNTLTL